MATRANPFTPGAQYVRPKPDEKILTARPRVRILTQAVQPPSQVYVQISDVLRITAASSQASEVLTVNYRLLLPSGDVVEGQSSFSVTGNRAVNIHDEPLAEGFLLSCSCKAAAATTRGQTFARIFLTNPVFGQGQPSYMLMSDYVTTRMAPAHPNGRVLPASDGPGSIRNVTQAAPALGADWSVTVPTNARWRGIALRASLSTDPTAVDRFAQLNVTAGGNIVFVVQGSALINASASLGFSAGAIAPAQVASSGVAYWPIPPQLILLAGGGFSVSTINLQAGDQWSIINLVVEEWLDNV